MHRMVGPIALTLFVSSLAAQTPIGESIRHGEPIHALAVSRDGKFIATGAGDNTARIWDAADATRVWDTAIDVDGLVGKALSRVFRELTGEERKSAMLPEVPNRLMSTKTEPEDPSARQPWAAT